MGTNMIRLIFLGVNFLIMTVTMATSTSYDRQINSYFWSQFLNIYIFLRLIFFILCHIIKMILPDILKWLKVKVVQTVFPIFSNLSFFQIYSISSLTDFHKYRAFDRNCAWSELRQFLFKIEKIRIWSRRRHNYREPP